MNSIEKRLAEANKHLTGAHEHHESIKDALAYIEVLRLEAKRGREIAKVWLPVMEQVRPLVLNLERLKDALHATEE